MPNLIVDATFSLQSARDQLRSWLDNADAFGYRTLALWLDAELAEIRARVDHRATTTPAWNGADVAVLEVMRSRTSPCWVGNRFDVTGLPPKKIFEMVLPLLEGTVPEVSAGRYFHMHAAMREASDRLRSGGRWPKAGSWVDTLLIQIDFDAREGTFDRWGESTLVESGIPLMAGCVPLALSARAGQKGSMARINAGLAHTYAYCLSDVLTEYGFKRDRWLDGRINAVLGVKTGFIEPAPIEGTLLGNVTQTLDAYLADAPVEWVTTKGAHVTGTLVERDPDSGIAFETKILAREGVPHEVLIYSVLPREGYFRRLYLTAFPVTLGYAATLAGQTRITGALAPRHNAYSPVDLSNEPATRVFEPGVVL